MQVFSTKKLAGRFKDNKGFTLVEVLTSFAVLAIISVALLQMFVVSAKTNKIAYDTDSAKAFCVKTGEIYKANPLDTRITSGCAITSAAGITTYTSYYDSQWSSPLDSPGADSVYELVVEQTTSATTSVSISYHPEFSWQGRIDSANEANTPPTPKGPYSLTISASGGQCEIDLDGAYPQHNVYVNPIKYTTEGAIVSLQVLCDDSSLTLSEPCKINVTNNAGTVVNPADGLSYPVIPDIYICDAPSGIDTVSGEVISGAGVEAVPVAGPSSVNYIKSGENDTGVYSAWITAKRLSDGQVMARYNVTKYFVR